jgi:copper chaperone
MGGLTVVTTPPKKEKAMITFQVNDMTCGHCASVIAKAVAAVEKSARIEFDIPAKRVRIGGTASAAELAEAIQDAGYTPLQLPAEPAAAAAPARAAGGCGCGCGPRKAAGFDAGQKPAAARGSCCG